MSSWKKHLTLGLAGCLLAAGLALTAQAGTWPDKPLYIVVPFPAGGAGDLVPRILGEELSKSLGQPVIVENKPGAQGAIGINYVAKSKPDGYTLGVASSGPVVIGKRLFPSLPYDPKKDLAPVALTYETPFVLVVPAASPIKSLADMVKQAKQRPGRLNIAIPNKGSVQHLISEQMKSEAGLDILDIPYNGGGPAIVAAASGEVDMTWAALPNAIGMLANGKVRAIAVSSSQRDPMIPDIATVVEQGWPTLVASNWNGLVAAAKTPEDILEKLNRAINAALRQPRVLKKFADMGISPLARTRQGFQDLMTSEETKWAKVIKAAKIEPM